MERSNQLPKTEGCSAGGSAVDLWFYWAERSSRSVLREWQQEGRGNDKKCRLALRESDRSIGFSRKV
jgi:hypothetical protein